MSFLRDDPDHIIMSAFLYGDLDLFKVSVRTGESERIAEGNGRTFAWYVDKDGQPAFRFNRNMRGTVIYVYAREERSNGKIKWRKIRTIRLKESRQNRDS